MTGRPWRRVAGGLAVAGAALLSWATPASAHALLLRTEPSPQTTVSQPPAVVRLHFSEAVEVTFGAVRVYDVDGHRVDTGSLHRTDANREVDVGVRTKSGTYTVTWRVVSADGHPVHGGFSFYVGAPSTISSVAIAGERGAGRTVGWGFGADRFVWFAAVLGLIGAATVRRWVWTPAVNEAGLEASEAAAHFRARFRLSFRALWAALLVAGLLALPFEAASVSGLHLLSSFRPSVLSDVLHTNYGHYWVAQIVLTVVLVAPVTALTARRRLWLRPQQWLVVLAVLIAGLCVTTSLNGHARTVGRAGLGVPSLAVHLFSVGVWAGGLSALCLLGWPSWRTLGEESRASLLRGLLPRFSRLAIGAVVAVVATGTANALLELNSWGDLWHTEYGRVVAAKVALLLLALVLAAWHLWIVPGRLRSTPRPAATSFALTAFAEAAFLVGAVALAAGLVVLVPGKSLALAANGAASADLRLGSYTVQFFVDPTGVGDNQIHMTFVGSSGLAAADVTNTVATFGADGGADQPIDGRLIAPGHFVADVQIGGAGHYHVTLSSPSAGSGRVTFRFRVRSGAGAG